MIKREPSFPLCVGYLRATPQNVLKWRQPRRKIRVFAKQPPLLPLARSGPSHLSHEVHHRVAMSDVDVEFVERVAAKPLEVLLNLYLDIMPCQVGAQLITVAAKLVGNCREKDTNRHVGAAPRRKPAFPISPQGRSRFYGQCMMPGNPIVTANG